MAFVNDTTLTSLVDLFLAANQHPPSYDVTPRQPIEEAGAGHVIGDGASPLANATHHVIKDDGDVHFLAILGISSMFCVIGVVGLVGNTLIIFFILHDKKMRHSVTNLFIMNMAISDTLIMLFGVPETVQFMLNRGWLLGEVMCKLERYTLVVSLYTSVITSVAVCVERYIAIIHPMKAHILCSRKKMTAVIGFVWPTVCLLALPVAMFNRLVSPDGATTVQYCVLRFPGNHRKYVMMFKYAEFGAFYLVPMVVQVVCYSLIAKQLFAGSKQLHRQRVVYNRESEPIKARKGVIKMLMLSVAIYFISYSPHQVLLLYNTLSRAPFHQTWLFLVLVTAMGYINSAANPVLYSIFSQNFRQKFRRALLCRRRHRTRLERPAVRHHDTTDSGVVLSSVRTYGSIGSKSRTQTWI